MSPEIIKQKVDEAVKECWLIIYAKAIEAGIEDGSTPMWLFYNRVLKTNYFKVNGIRLKVNALMEEDKPR